MRLHDVDFSAAINQLKKQKPQKGEAYIERQLLKHAPEIMALLDQGYSEEQLFNCFPEDAFAEIEMDQKKFVRKVRITQNKYKKSLEKSQQNENPETETTNKATTDDTEFV